MYDVICVGSALLDVFVRSDKFTKISNGEFAGGVGLCEEYGGKVEVEEMVMVSGGGGTNVAVSLARKGLKTALIAEVGRDLVAGAIKQELVGEDIDLMLMREVEGEVTGMSVILVASDGGRSALIARGAAKMLTTEDVAWDKLETKWLYVSSLGGEWWLMQSLIGHARDHSLKIAVNPGRAEIEKIKAQGYGTSQVQALWSGVEVLLLNREEAYELYGVDLLAEERWRGGLEPGGPKVLVVTDGKRGGRVYQGSESFDFTALEVKTVEETGAGDAFGSGLVAALIWGKEIREAVEWGRRQAAAVVRFMGAKRGLMTRAEMETK